MLIDLKELEMSDLKQIPKLEKGFQERAGVTFADNSPEFLLAVAKEYGDIAQFSFGPFKFISVGSKRSRPNSHFLRDILQTVQN